MSNKIAINENSVITMKEASEILDELFRCGEKLETKAVSYVTGEEIDAYYYDHSLAEEVEHLNNIFEGTLYNPAKGDQETFEKDFIKWVHLGWEINLLMQKRTGDYLWTDKQDFFNKQSERNEIWEKIKPVFYKDKSNQYNEIQDISPEKIDSGKISRKKKGRPVKSFDEVLVVDKENTKRKLHNCIEGKSGEAAVIYIKAAIKLGMIQTPTYTQFKNEFGDIVSKTIYNKYIKEEKYTADEMEGAKRVLE